MASTWQSLNSTFNDLPAEFARLYSSLTAFGKEGGSVATKSDVGRVVYALHPTRRVDSLCVPTNTTPRPHGVTAGL